MQAYDYERQGDGYVFSIYKPRHQGLVLALFPIAAIAAFFTFGIALVVWLIWAIMRLVKNKAGSEITYTNKIIAKLTVTPEEIVTGKGKEVPTARMHSIGIKNGYDRGFQVATARSSSGGWLVGGSLGLGMAAADGLTNMSSGMRNAVQNQRGKTAFFLVAEVAGREEKLTTPDLSETAARALQTDIIRVIQGQNI